VSACRAGEMTPLKSIAQLGQGWQGQIVAQVDQSYVGWDIEIGDADNDGKNEVLATGCPDSRLYLFKKTDGQWQTRLLAENLAQAYPAMGLTVRVVDLDRDGKNEIILGTGQEGHGTAFFYVFQTDGRKLTKRLFSRPACNKSGYTHNLATWDLDHDGVLEVISAYCGGGEVIRYDLDPKLTNIEARKIAQLSGSGEESLIVDVDNDGQPEYVTSNSFRDEQARVEIFEFDQHGELAAKPRVVIDGFEGRKCFYASILVGDIDNDGKNEMVVGWKRKQKINKTTLLAYRIDAEASDATVVCTFAHEDEDLDMGYFEKMMCIADVDNDGKNELIVSTRGDNMSERIASRHLGRVYVYRMISPKNIERELVVDFHQSKAQSSWVAVGDADNDGKNEILLATGKGDRTKPGTSYVVLIEKKQPSRNKKR